MRFSIIILCYNNFEYLDECLDSIKKQKYKDYEVVFSDDCSKNIDKEIISKKMNCFADRVLIFNDINLGTVKNFNNAIKRSKGDIIVPLSIDDRFYDENSLNNIDSFFSNNNCYIATSLLKTFGEIDGLVLPYKNKIKLFNNMEKLHSFELRYYNFISGCNIFYSRELFKKIGLFDENYKLIEDHHFILKVIENGYNFFFIDKIILSYRINNLKQKKVSSLREKDHIHLIDSYLQKCPNFFTRRCLKYSKRIIYSSFLKKLIYSLIYIDVSLRRLYIKLVYR